MTTTELARRIGASPHALHHARCRGVLVPGSHRRGQAGPPRYDAHDALAAALLVELAASGVGGLSAAPLVEQVQLGLPVSGWLHCEGTDASDRCRWRQLQDCAQLEPPVARGARRVVNLTEALTRARQRLGSPGGAIASAPPRARRPGVPQCPLTSAPCST